VPRGIALGERDDPPPERGFAAREARETSRRR
jgi:hypothetical protein